MIAGEAVDEWTHPNRANQNCSGAGIFLVHRENWLAPGDAADIRPQIAGGADDTRVIVRIDKEHRSQAALDDAETARDERIGDIGSLAEGESSARAGENAKTQTRSENTGHVANDKVRIKKEEGRKWQRRQEAKGGPDFLRPHFGDVLIEFA